MILPEEIVRVLLFLALVAAVYATAAWLLVRRILLELRARGAPGPRPRFGRFARVVFAVALVGIGCIAYGSLVEPRWLEVTHHAVPTSKLPRGARPVRIVHLTDIHSNPEPLLEDELPAVVASLRPDLVVYTGDSANGRRGAEVFRRCLAAIAGIAPTFVVEGNHDVHHARRFDPFAGTGAVELDGTAARVVVDGVPIHVAGVAYGREHLAADALRDVPPGEPCIFLAHMPYPDILPQTLPGRVDLMCAGHVHGGQVALPFYGALLTLSKHGKRYESGLYPIGGGAHLYVSRGIGMEGGGVPRVRFLARPEVALLELVPE